MNLNLAFKIKILFFVISLGFLLSMAFAKTENNYPEPIEEYVNDYADVIAVYEAGEVRRMLKDLEEQTGVEATVVTVNSIKDYDTGDETIESFATNLFNAWGIGDEEKDNGILILAAVIDREVRIELGSGYDEKYDSIAKKIIDKKMVPYFQEYKYTDGIYEGSSAVIKKIAKGTPWLALYRWHVMIGALGLICAFAIISCIRSGSKGWGWLLFIGIFSVFLFLIKLVSLGKISGGKSTGGFGGGRSSGGGASGKW